MVNTISNTKPYVHVLQIVGSQIGGIRKHVHSILLGLNHQDFKLSYAYSSVTQDSRFRRDIAEIGESIGGSLLPLTIQRQPGLSDVINLWKIGLFLARTDVDVIHGHGAKGGLYARTLSRIFGLKAVYTPHGGTAHNMFPPVMNVIYTGVERVLSRWTDYCLFESEYTAAAMQDKLGYPFRYWRVNYNGVSPMLAKTASQGRAEYPTQRVDGVNLGVFGMLRMEKGQRYAIEAVAQLLRQGKAAQLHIFGDGPDRTVLEGLAGDLGVIRHVVFHGDVIDVETWLARMDMILIPSLFESFGYVAVEAMSLGKPVIASRVGGLTEVVINDQTGILVQPGDSQAFAEAVSELLENPNDAVRLSENGFCRYRQMFTEDRMLDIIAETYHLLAAQRETSKGN